MTVTFYSNFLNHHQLPFCMAMDRLTGGHFVFVASEPIPEERKQLGYADMNKAYPFVLTTYDSPENLKYAGELAVTSDIVIHGAAPEEYVRLRMEENKLTFRFLERLHKNGGLRTISPRLLYAVYQKHFKYRRKELYLLCASAYTAGDYRKHGCYRGKSFKWGYFPEVKTYDIEALLRRKQPEYIVWAGRLLELKHPETAVKTAEYLEARNIPFKMKIIGMGPMEEKLREMIRDRGLEERITLTGALPPEAVREEMEKAAVFLFSSDRQEGWGAVLNEAMNSGCAVVANDEIGSVRFLIRDRENGFVYRHGNVRQCAGIVEKLLKDRTMCEEAGRKAYHVMVSEWNAQRAAEKLLKLSEGILENATVSFESGVCSKA